MMKLSEFLRVCMLLGRIQLPPRISFSPRWIKPRSLSPILVSLSTFWLLPAESSAVSYANSVLGARTNREGGPSALAAAKFITGEGDDSAFGSYVPEPATGSMLVGGLLVLLGLGRRRQRN